MRISMKIKLLIVVMVLIISASFINAEDNNTTINEIDIKVSEEQQNSVVFGDTNVSPELINPTKLDSNVNIAQTPFMDNENWAIWRPANKQTLNTKQIEALRNTSYDLEREPRFWQTHKYQSDNILILPQFIYGYDTVTEMGYIKVTAHKAYLLEGIICEALYLAMLEGNINNAIVLVRGMLITNGKVISIGGFIGGGTPIGSATDINKIVVTGASGSGIGWSKAWVAKGFEVKIISYSHVPANYFAKLKSQSDKKNAVNTTVSAHKDPTVNFDTGEYTVKSSLSEYPEKENQDEIIESIILKIHNDWEKLISNNTTIWFIGGADERASREYNALLGLNRGKEVSLVVAKSLVNKYNHNPEEVVKVIKYASTGKDEPISNAYKINRVVYMVRGEIISKIN